MQIFDVDVTQNHQLNEEFLICMRDMFVHIDSKLGLYCVYYISCHLSSVLSS